MRARSDGKVSGSYELELGVHFRNSRTTRMHGLHSLLVCRCTETCPSSLCLGLSDGSERVGVRAEHDNKVLDD